MPGADWMLSPNRFREAAAAGEYYRMMLNEAGEICYTNFGLCCHELNIPGNITSEELWDILEDTS